ncbi:cadherin-related family member 5 isoform X2 [Bufo bufo]|uniref:cadherin-related family member 5 isoform X2 n=1 Tax=Bufo bufo TaxID=8384 RepID=UPI001ABDB227|nr:cadherin-related family member 5 isoform X2 [Bufo bufo]
MGPLLALCILLLIPMGCLSQACRADNPTPAIREDEKPGTVVTRLIIDSGHTVEVNSTKFGIVNSTNLVLTEEVDYEVETLIRVTLICKNNGQIVPGGIVYVQIINVNDNAPVFKEASYHFSIAENLPVNSAIGPAMQAEDADLDTLYYELIGNDTAAGYFRLSSVTNPLILLNRSLDYDLQPHIRLNLTARDTEFPDVHPSFTATTSIIIDIIDADDKPPFFQPCRLIGTKICISNGYTSSVNRAEQATQPLQLMPGPLYAVDGDYGINDPISYSIISGNENSIFSINTGNGNITMDKSVDTLRTFLLQVMAYQSNDIQKYATTTVQIEVKEKNNFPPIFQMSNYYGTIATNTDIGSFVRNSSDQSKSLQVFASDRDFPDGFNLAVIYKVENSTDFTVLRDGYILTSSVFNSPGTTALLVSATDGATSERTTTLVTIEITQTLTTTPSTTTSTTKATTHSTPTTISTTSGTGTTTTTTPSTQTTTSMTAGTGTTTTTTPSTRTTTITTAGTGTTTTTTPSTQTTTSTTAGTGTTTTTTPSTRTTTSTTAGTGTTTTTIPSTQTTTSTTTGTGTTTTTTPSTQTTTSTTTGTGTTTTTTPSTRTTTSTTTGTGTTTTTTPSTQTTTSTTTGTGTTTTTTPSTQTTTSTTTGTGTTTTTTPSTRTTTSTTTVPGTTTTTTPSSQTTTSTTTGTGTTPTPTTWTTTSTTTGTGTTRTTTPSTRITTSGISSTGITTTPSTQTTKSTIAETGTVTTSPATETGTITGSTTTGTVSTAKNPEPGTEGVLQNAKYFTSTDMAILGATLGAVLALSLVGLAFLIYKQYGNTIRSRLMKGSGNNSGGSGDRQLINEEDNLSVTLPSNLDFGIDGDIVEVSSENNLLSAAAVTSVLLTNAPAGSQSLEEEDGGSDSEDKKVKSILTKDLKEDGGYKSVWFREDAPPEVMVIEGAESGEANDDDTEEEFSNQHGEDDDEEEEDEDELNPTFSTSNNNAINSNNITIF